MKITVAEGRVEINGKEYGYGTTINIDIPVPEGLNHPHVSDDKLVELSIETESNKIPVKALTDHAVVGVTGTSDYSMIRVFKPYTMIGENDRIMMIHKDMDTFFRGRGRGEPVIELYGG